MRLYVLGFVFTPDANNVILIRKIRPEWQRGLLNGLGGKIEHGETPSEAMSREAREEAAVNVVPHGWDHFATMEFERATIYCFRCTWNEPVFNGTDEIASWYRLADMPSLHLIPNLRWLIPMALDPERPGGSLLARAQ